MPWLSASLVRLSHKIAYYQIPGSSPSDLVRSLASSCGPSVAEAASRTSSGDTYGRSVRMRAGTAFPGDWDGRVRIYREGLALSAWSPTYPGSGPMKDSIDPKTRPSTFQCPVKIVFGMRDIALDPRIVLNGIEQHFMPEASTSGRRKQRVLKLPDSGHWCMLEPVGASAIEAAVRSAFRAESKP